MTTNYTKILVLCVILVLKLIHFLGQRLGSTEFVTLKILDHPIVLYEILLVFYLVSIFHRISSKSQPDYKWEYLKKCDILRFLQNQDTFVFCLDDYIRDFHDTSLPRHELMRHEWARLVSFNTFPQEVSHVPSAIRLAGNGFYYTDDGTIVECFCCRQRFDATTEENTERAHSETCAFAADRGSRNVPISSETVLTRPNSNRNGEGSNSMQSLSEAQQSRPVTNHNLRRRRAEINSQLLASAGFCHTDWNNDELICFEYGSATLVEVCNNEYSSQTTEETDSLLRDLQSPGVQRILQMGYDYRRVRMAVIELRRVQGRGELSAKDILDYIHDTEPNLILSNTVNGLSAALVQFFIEKNQENQVERERSLNVTIRQLEDAIRQLEDRVITLKREKICKVCLDKDICIVFLPCGHLVACDDCARFLRKCPVCRAMIKGTVRTYLS